MVGCTKQTHLVLPGSFPSTLLQNPSTDRIGVLWSKFPKYVLELQDLGQTTKKTNNDTRHKEGRNSGNIHSRETDQGKEMNNFVVSLVLPVWVNFFAYHFRCMFF